VDVYSTSLNKSVSTIRFLFTERDEAPCTNCNKYVAARSQCIDWGIILYNGRLYYYPWALWIPR